MLNETVSNTAFSDALDAAIAVKLSRGQKAAATRRANEAKRAAAPNTPKVDIKDENILTPIQVMVAAIVVAEKADSEVKAAFIKAGADQSDVINAYYAARVMVTLDVTYEQALIVCGKKNLTKNVKEVTDKHRTLEEQRAYVAATVHLTASRKRWGIATTSTQGGARTTKVNEGLDTNDVELPKKIDIKTPPDFVTFMHALANTAYAVCLKNKDTAIVKSDAGSEVMGACADFAATMAEIVAKYQTAK